MQNLKKKDSIVLIPLILSKARGNSTSKTAVVVVPSATTKTLSYDNNGNLTNNGAGRTLEYDAENRVVAINEGTHRTEPRCTGSTAVDLLQTANPQGDRALGKSRNQMSYDGLNRRVKIIEKENSITISTQTFVWCGDELCEERDTAGGTVAKRYYSQGFSIINPPSTLNYYYAKDHLGSIRALVDSTGAARGRWSFSLWGERSANLVVANPVNADFGFTGYYVNSQYQNLAFPENRIYDSDLGRFTSRDPIAERGGMNVYGYVFNNPVNAIDLLGLDATFTCTDGSRQTASTAEQFRDVVTSAAPGSIDGILVNGHASSTFQSFNEGRPTQNDPGLSLRPDGTVALTDGKGNTLGNLSDLLKDKFHQQGGQRLGLLGCNTAKGDKNITQAASAALPGVAVYGSPGSTVGNIFLPKAGAFLAPAGDKIYVNGQRQ